MRTESTFAFGVLLPPDDRCADSAAPKFAALMSEGVQELPHRSAAPPYEAKASVVGQFVAVDLSVAPIVPPLTTRIALSATVPLLEFLRSHSTWMPWTVAFAGIENPKPVH